jgi:hypothetical protein
MFRSHLVRLLATVLPLIALSACGAPDQDNKSSSTDKQGKTPAGSDKAQPHVHAHDDVLFWQREGIEHEDALVSLGHHGAHIHAGEELEPAVSVTRDGQPVADARVWFSLVDQQGNEAAGPAAATYEPPTDEEPAHYAMAKLLVPGDAARIAIRYRVELSGGEAMVRDVTVPVEKHE